MARRRCGADFEVRKILNYMKINVGQSETHVRHPGRAIKGHGWRLGKSGFIRRNLGPSGA